VLAVANTVQAQGVINPVTHDFVITCTGPLPPNAVSQPFGSGDLSNNVLTIGISVGPSAFTSASVLTAAGGSLAPVFPITNQVNLNPPAPGLTLPSYYGSGQSWQVTDSQAADIWAGLWYVEFTFATGTDTGRIIAVPEPTSFKLFFIGVGFLAFTNIRKRLRQNS